jgi:hypothetical protein
MSDVKQLDDDDDDIPAAAGNNPAIASLELAFREGYRKAAETATGGSKWLLRRMAEGQSQMDRMGFPKVAQGERHVTLLTRPGATKLLIAFAGTFASIRILPVLMRRPDCHLAYVRDTTKMWHVGEIPGLGGSFKENIGAFHKLADALKAPAVSCLGVSSGSYAALKFGLHMGAKAVLGIGTPTTNRPEDYPEEYSLTMNRYPQMLELMKTDPMVAEDMAAAYRAAKSPPKVTLAYGDGNARDKWSSERMADIPGVTMHSVEGWQKHVLWMELVRSGAAEKMLDDLMA